MTDYSRELETAIDAARKAGDILMKHYGKVTVRYKSDGSLVTDADIESEKRIKDILGEKFPDYSLLGEESGRMDKASEYTWVIDPLDGTTNYSIQNPFFNVSIALARGDDPVLGVVYYPFQDELFHAVKDGGAYLNNERIKVSERDIRDSVICFCHAHDREAVKTVYEIFRRIKQVNCNLRQIGAAALELSYVACGRVGAFFTINLKPWDVAAGAVIVKEAGGRVTDFRRNPFTLKAKDILASNGRMHEDLLGLINQ